MKGKEGHEKHQQICVRTDLGILEMQRFILANLSKSVQTQNSVFFRANY